MSENQPRHILAERNQSHRIDFLRGIFAVWVFIAHSFELAFETIDHPLGQGAAGRWISTLFHSGYIGVMGFFFLSGFCIQWSISNTLEKRGPKKFPLAAYFRARFLRIAPLFYLGVALALLVNWLAIRHLNKPNFVDISPAGWQETTASLGFLQGVFGTLPLYGPSWSITNEVVYYIAWPVLLSATCFHFKRSFVLAGLLALASTAVFYLLWKKLGDQDWIVMTALWGIPLASLMWILGAVCREYYQAIVTHKLFITLQRWWWLVLLLWIGWATTLIFLEAPLIFRLLLDPFAYLAIPLLVLANWKAPVSPFWVRWLADLSYPLYLFHIPLLVFFISALYSWQAPQQQLAVVCAMALAFTLSGTIGVALERKFMRLKTKIS